MNVTASDYANELEATQINLFRPYLPIIKDFIKNDKLKIVVDIGCGSGKITSLVSEALNCDKVIGIDSERDMIEFAIANNHCTNIEYLSQDISVEWDEMRPELKSLEGSVALVFSNIVFHWIKRKQNAIRNIYRLLSPFGKFFARVLTVFDPLSDAIVNDDYNYVKQFLQIPSKEEQLNEWKTLLNTNGLIVEKSELTEILFNCRDETYETLVLSKVFLKLLSLYVLSDNENEIEEFMRKSSNFLRERVEQSSFIKYVNEETGDKMAKCNFWTYMTCAVKNCSTNN